MDYWNQPRLKDLFKKEEVVVVKKEYRRMYKIRWKNLFRNLYNFLAFWKVKHKRLPVNTIVHNQTDNEIALLKQHTISAGVDCKNNMEA